MPSKLFIWAFGGAPYGAAERVRWSSQWGRETRGVRAEMRRRRHANFPTEAEGRVPKGPRNVCGVCRSGAAVPC
eukprot:4227959-Pyramimonas_sp.AAC.1